ncbi:MAG TPA: hypothetical protein VKT52_03745, partial [Ktedonobacterales bacterium]|nr:hypothetical protein [Ktedonobacterales bacterium]
MSDDTEGAQPPNQAQPSGSGEPAQPGMPQMPPVPPVPPIPPVPQMPEAAAHVESSSAGGAEPGAAPDQPEAETPSDEPEEAGRASEPRLRIEIDVVEGDLMVRGGVSRVLLRTDDERTPDDEIED